MIGVDWLWNEFETTLAEKVSDMKPSEMVIVRDILSEMCLNQPEGSPIRQALRTAIGWVGEKYADALTEVIRNE